MAVVSDNSSENQAKLQKQKWWRGPQKLNPEERKNAKYAYIFATIGILTFVLQFIYFANVYTIGDWVCIVIFWIVFLMPAYMSNAGMAIWGGKTPIDFGYVCKDGRRLFGPGKTWRGFMLGPLLFAIPLSLLVHWIFYINWNNIVVAVGEYSSNSGTYSLYSDYNTLIRTLALYLLGDANGSANLPTFFQLLPRIILCSFAAPVGDLIKSWAKRRKGLDRGEPWWGFDQFDFIIACILFGIWFVLPGYNIHVFIMTMLITPTITVIANTLNYLSGHKKVPW